MQVWDNGLRERGIDCVGKALQPIDDRNQGVRQASVFHLVHHRGQNLAPPLCSIQMPRISFVRRVGCNADWLISSKRLNINQDGPKRSLENRLDSPFDGHSVQAHIFRRMGGRGKLIELIISGGAM